MERYTLSTSIDPIEVAFLGRGLSAAIGVAAVRAVERGALRVEDERLVPGDPGRAEDPFARALVDLTAGGKTWPEAHRLALVRGREDGRALERRLVATGLLRESPVLRVLRGRPTARGKLLLDTARRAFPREQIAPLDPALALALYGVRGLAGTPYAMRRDRGQGNAASAGTGGAAGFLFADGGGDAGSGAGGGHSGCGGHGCGGGSGCGGGGGCGGGCGA